MGEGILELIKGVELTCSLCFLLGRRAGGFMDGILGFRKSWYRGQKRKDVAGRLEWVENTLTRSKWASALGGEGGGSLMRMRRGCRRR